MYKLIIVDDEVVTRDDLADLLNMQDTGFEIVGLFDDGAAALNYIENHRVDLVLTDIKMPCMDGLALSKYIYNNHRETAVIIISGYEDFAYAQKALEYNIKGYLLKPIDFDDLLSVLEKTKKEIKKTYGQKKIYSEWRYENQVEFLRKLYLGLYETEDEIIKAFESAQFLFGIDASKGRVVKIVLEKYDEFLKKHWNHGQERISIAIKNIIDKTYVNCYNYILFQQSNEIYAVIFSDSDKDAEMVAYIKEILSVDACIQGEKSFCSLLEISDGFLGETEIAEIVTRINTYILSMDIRHAQLLLKKCINRFSESPESERLLNLLKEKFMTALSVYWNIGIIRNTDICDLAEHLEQYISELISTEEKNDDIIIERTKEFIASNYNHDISMSDIAKNVYLSAEYFGRYFKKMTGQSVNSFLLETRMKQAVSCLKTDKTVKEISDSVGYADYRYFIKVFKKYTGYSPSEYRKKFM